MLALLGSRPPSWPSLWHDRRAASALEFAIIGPVFMLLLLLVLETGWQLTIDIALRFGVIAGSRYAITGIGYAAGTRDSTILSTIVSGSGGILNQANLTLTPRAYASPAAYASGGSATASTGASGQLVVYTVTYKQSFFTGLPTAILGYSAITHTATFVVQNEPF